MNRGLRTLLILAGILLCAVLPAQGGKIYWSAITDGPALPRALLFRANLDGTGQEVLFNWENAVARGVALSFNNNKMYWADAAHGAILRADLNGCGSEFLVTGQPNPVRVVVDDAASKIYWVNENGIRRGDLDGGAIETLLTGQGLGDELALDRPNEKIYFGSLEGIRRMEFDGSNVELVVPGPGFRLRDIAVDEAGGKLYWAEGSSDPLIQRSNLDGSGIELVLSQTEPIESMALDLTASKIYFGYGWPVGTDGIRRANLDGTGVEEVISGLSSTVNAIALDPEDQGVDPPGSCGAGVPAISTIGAIALVVCFSLTLAWFLWRRRAAV
jgi:DNA-binding beta-propeller fold protein YncE